MATANFDELMFFLDGNAQAAMRVSATGASTTQVMVAMSVHEAGRTPAVPTEPVQAVCAILDDLALEAQELDPADLVDLDDDRGDVRLAS